MQDQVSVEGIVKASHKLKNIIIHTQLEYSASLSVKYDCKVYLKREDLQVVRSYKIRGAYNKITSLPKEEVDNGVVCASAGNHAQGVAYACSKLGIKGYIFMPATTPKQKVKQVSMFGGENVELILSGDTFDDSYALSQEYCKKNKLPFIHPFDDEKIIEGQGTVGAEILEDAKEDIDYLFVPIGGGGLISGVGTYFTKFSPETKIIGVEPQGAPAMKESILRKEVVILKEIDKFVDGAAVKSVGQKTLSVTKEFLTDVTLVPEGKACTFILNLYNESAMVVEPAGSLSIAALDFHKEDIKGKTVVCIVSGGNNDISRMQEIKERSLMYEGLLHYFVVNFPQRAGALRDFLNDVLGPNDDITRFEYIKKSNREAGPALVGIELKYKEDYDPLLNRLNDNDINYSIFKDDPILFSFFINLDFVEFARLVSPIEICYKK